ncbi:MAG: hypothetical protein ABFD97_01320 [Syntrophobacter sp.]
MSEERTALAEVKNVSLESIPRAKLTVREHLVFFEMKALSKKHQLVPIRSDVKSTKGIQVCLPSA